MSGTDFNHFFRSFKRYSKKVFTTRVVVLIALTAMVLISIMCYRSVIKLNRLARLVNHTHLVQLHVQRTYSALSDADSELKAFLITKDSAYYFKLIKEEALIRESLHRLNKLTLDDESQNNRFSSLDSLVRARWLYMEEILKGNEDQYDYVSGRIEKCNTLLESSIQTINVEEEKLLQSRSDNASRYQSSAPKYLLALQILVVLFLLIVFFLVKRDLRTMEMLQRETVLKNRELENQRDFIQGIFENTVDVIFIFDSNLNILALNKRAKDLYDSNHDAIGRNILELYPQAHGSQFIESTIEALRGKHVHTGARESTVHEGIFYESFFVPLYSTNKTIFGAMAIHHDVSDIMRMTSEVQAVNNELKKSNYELEQFAYVASHDLQEPLRKISTFSDLASRNIENKEGVAKNLEKISDAARRMSGLINDILNYSKLSNATLKHEKADLNRILEQVLQDFELTIEEKGAIIEGNSLPTVMGSQQQLTQVFSNIISNALKFCTGIPHIKIICRQIGDKYEISVSDNGIGFDQDFAEQIFRVFHRLNNRNHFSGTGIGLAVCKRIIENHGGTIKATSSPGQGTTITISIPALDQKKLISMDMGTLQDSLRVSLEKNSIALKNEAKHNPFISE